MHASFVPCVEMLEDRCVCSLPPIFEGQAVIGEGAGPKAPGTLEFLIPAGFGNSGLGTLPWKPFGDAFTGGFRVATADLNNDGYRDLVASTGPGVPGTVLIYDGRALLDMAMRIPYGFQNPQSTLLAMFTPFGSSYTNGLFVSATYGTIVVSADQGAAPQVSVYNTMPPGTPLPGAIKNDADEPVRSTIDLQPVISFFAYASSFHGGVRTAILDINGDGSPEILTVPGPGGLPFVSIHSGTNYVTDVQTIAAFGGSTPFGYMGGLTISSLDREPTPFPDNPTQANDAFAQMFAVSTQNSGALVGLWNVENSGGFYLQAFYAHPFPVGVHVGLGLTRTDPYTLEPVLNVAFDNLGYYLVYRTRDVFASANPAPLRGNFIPPGIYSNIPVDHQDPSNPVSFVIPQGGWVS